MAGRIRAGDGVLLDLGGHDSASSAIVFERNLGMPLDLGLASWPIGGDQDQQKDNKDRHDPVVLQPGDDTHHGYCCRRSLAGSAKSTMVPSTCRYATSASISVTSCPSPGTT